MLQFMRKNAKNWLMKVLLVIIILVFIFYFGSTRGRSKAEAVATVGDKKISYADLRKEYENLLDLYRRQYGENLTEETLKKLNLKQQALDSLINEAVIVQKAGDLKIEVSNEEVQASIVSYPAFQRNGVFDNRIYQQALRNLKMTPEDFEEAQKKGMMIAKIEGLMKENVKVSEREVLDIYRIQNEKTDLTFLKLSCRDYSGKVKATDADLESLLKEKGESFRVPERVQVKYLLFRPEDFSRSAPVSDEEVKDYYNLHRDAFKKKNGERAPLADVKEKIVSAVRLAKAADYAQAEAKKARNTIYQEENFDEYARRNNLAVHTSESFTRNHLPGELSGVKDLGQQLDGLKPDQISPVLSTPRGFFILKLVSRKSSYIPNLAEIRGEVEKGYRLEQARKLCQQDAEEILGRLKKGADLGQVSREKGLKTSETGFFSGAAIPKIGTSREIAQAVFQISAKRPYPDRTFLVDDQYVIIRFKDRKMEAKDFDAKKMGIAQFLLRLKENLYFQSWIGETREALLKAGKIKISEDAAKL